MNPNEEDHFMPFYKFKHCSKMDLCIKNDRFHKDTNTIKMRYRNSKGEKVKVNSSLRAPFKETLAVVLSCQYQAHYQNDSRGLDRRKKLLEENKNLVSEICIIQDGTFASIIVIFEDGHTPIEFCFGFSNFFEDLSRELGFKHPLGEQLLKDMIGPCEKVHRMICEKIHRMIAIHALGVQPN